MKYKTLLVEKTIDCPNCGEILGLGEIMYKDDYRGNTICYHCRNEYEEEVASEEGGSGELLK
jgi:hypothetical protein